MFALRTDAMTMKEGDARLQARRAATSASATNGCVGRNGPGVARTATSASAKNGCEGRNGTYVREGVGRGLSCGFCVNRKKRHSAASKCRGRKVTRKDVVSPL